MKVRTKTKLEVSDWELLQNLQEALASNLKTKDLGKKLSDLLKIVELKYKIKDESQREKIFWEMVEDLRKEVLGEPESRKPEEHEGHEKGYEHEKHEKSRKATKKKAKADKIEALDINKKEEYERE